MKVCKKICRIGLLVSILSAFLYGCSESKPTKANTEPVVVTIWNYYNGAQQAQFDELVQQFNDSVGARENIIVEAISKGTIDELIQALLDSAEHKVGADALPTLCAAYADTALNVDQQGLLADMTPYLTEEELAQYVDGYIEEGRFASEDSLKILPLAKSTEVLVLNQTDWEPFAEATGTTTEELTTWEGLARVAEQYYQWTDAQTEEPNDGKAFFGRDAFANYMLVGSYQLGHEIFRLEDGQVVMDFDRDAMRRLWDNYYVPYIRGYYLAEGKFRSDDLKTGNVIAYVGSTSGAPYMPTAVTYEDGTSYEIACTILPLPNFEGTVPCAVQQGAGAVMIKSEERVEQAAMTFLKWFTQADINTEFAMASGYLPVMKSANDEAFLEQLIEREGAEISAGVKDTLIVGMQAAHSSKLYTMHPFEGSDSLRTVINNSMYNRAVADRMVVEEQLAQGADAAEATAPFCTDAQFEDWYEETKQTLTSIYNK